MQNSIKQCALAGCISIIAGGCALHPKAGPEYRLSTSLPAVDDSSSMLKRGKAQLDADLNAMAIESFRSEIRHNPNGAEAYNGLAIAYSRLGRDDLAKRYFETALAKDPANARANSNLAKLNEYNVEFRQSANMARMASQFEPVELSRADEAEADPVSHLIENLKLPELANVQLAAPIAAEFDPPETLAKQGLLSKRFDTAPAQVALLKAQKMDTPDLPIREEPGQPPVKRSSLLPFVNLPNERKNVGSRLERISLSEVRLITRPIKSESVPTTKPDFESFGDRLAAWLPDSIAAEQIDNDQGGFENPVMMAAIERAKEGRQLANADGALEDKIPEFVYLFFDDSNDTADV